MKYLHREIPVGKTYADLIAEDPNVEFDYFVSENAVEPNSMEVTSEQSSWSTYMTEKSEEISVPEDSNVKYSIESNNRLYLVKGKWYGPNTSYGIYSYYHANSNYKSTAATTAPTGLTYKASGWVVEEDGFLESVELHGFFNRNDMQVHFAINAQTKTLNSTSVDNRILYHDVTPKVSDTINNAHCNIILEVNKPVFKGEVITLMANRSDSKGNTKYFYTNGVIKANFTK